MTSPHTEQLPFRRSDASSGSSDPLKRIKDALGHHPTAVSCALAYMKASKISPDAYLARLQPEIAAEQARCGDLHAATYAVLSVSYKAIPSGAQKLLLLLSCFSSNDFPLQLVRHAANDHFDYEMYEAVRREKQEITVAVSRLKEIFYVEGNFDDGELRRNRHSLKQYNFIFETPSGELDLVSMRPEVKFWAQSRMDQRAKATYQAAAIQLLGRSPKDQDSMDKYLAPQIMEFKATFGTLHTNDKASFASVLYRTGEYEQSLPLFKQVANDLERKCGRAHQETVLALTWLATVEQANKDYEAAVTHRKIVVNETRRIFEPGDPRVAAVEASLAESYASLGQYELARRLYEKVLELRKILLGNNDPDTLATSAELAGVYQSLGLLDEALKLRRDVYIRRNNAFGKDDPNTILAANNLGVTYYDAAMSRKRALHSGEEVEGGEGVVRDFLVEARELQVQVLRYRRTSTLGNMSPDTQAAMKNLMWTYYELNQTTDAEQEAKTLCGASTKSRGPNDSFTLRARLALALFQKNLTSATKIQEAIKEGHPDYEYATNIVRAIEASQEKPREPEKVSCFKSFLRMICEFFSVVFSHSHMCAGCCL